MRENGKSRVLGVDDEEVNLTLQAGANDFLSKPVDRAELTVRLGNLLKVKEFQDFLQDHNRILEEQVAERTHQLQEAHRRIKLAYVEAVHRLTAAEYRDEDTGAHTQPLTHYSLIHQS